MNEEDRLFLAQLVAQIGAISDGRPPVAPDASRACPLELTDLANAVRILAVNFDALRQFSIALANGKIDAETPPKLHLLDSLKSLQASLKHLTWQTQEVAAGNLEQKVDFLGDFSIAFNQMVTSLKDKRRAEQEAMQASKLASIGQLAAGIAHEINTPAQYVSDNLSFLGTSLPAILSALQGGPPLPKQEIEILEQDLLAATKEATEGIERISKIVLSMKEFSHPGATEMTTSDINRALESTLTVSQNAWKMAAEIERRFDPALPGVVCHASEINQVFLNLILNAAQAIEGSGQPLPGRIVIETSHDTGWVNVKISDNGPGVPTSLRERIFDLFFTTKPVGKGTGQGLAICKDVIEVKHKGHLMLDSLEGQGAVFIIRLPVDGSVS